ncbi:MAG: uracil-DNA glycosylase [Bacteroidetes bacterium]|nr:MAG: uracil-DNA glycosylase [Bacteroidota bacterium]
MIDEEWKAVLWEEFQASYFDQLKSFLVEEKKSYTIYPPGKEIFSAFNLTPFSKVKAVILGQDPYHGAGQAHGLCFSVPRGVMQPPSLKNILKEMADDININIPTHGNLSAWAEQGVLLINATLTVRAHQAGSHQGRGWEQFTDAVIHHLSQQKEHLVFFLWGNYARNKKKLIDPEKHLILENVHPSPLSAHRGFFGSKPFSQANNYLSSHHIPPIDWQI